MDGKNPPSSTTAIITRYGVVGVNKPYEASASPASTAFQINTERKP